MSPSMSVVDAAPMCTPDNNPYVTSSNPVAPPNSVAQGNIVIDASILALNQSFVCNNKTAGPNMDQVILYGSIQQEARGGIGEHVDSQRKWSAHQ